MNLKEFFDADEKIAIHCGTEEKAIKLCQAFQDMGKKWSSGSNYLYSTFWNSHKRLTCYTNKGSFDKKCWFEETGVKVIPFNEIEDFKDEIHITQTGNTIHAVYKADGKVVDRKKAVCPNCGAKMDLEVEE